jgi:hypothetical protein
MKQLLAYTVDRSLSHSGGLTVAFAANIFSELLHGCGSRSAADGRRIVSQRFATEYKRAKGKRSDGTGRRGARKVCREKNTAEQLKQVPREVATTVHRRVPFPLL